MTTELDRQAVIVLGMHRSGTSLLSGLCRILGLDLGTQLIPAASDNPSGFWENERIVRFHDELLQSLNRSWDSVLPLPEGWVDLPELKTAPGKLRSILKDEFGERGSWAIKDPRLCLLLPLWKRVLGDLDIRPHYLIVYRHPDEIYQSLLKRNGLSRSHSYLLYLLYYISAERNSRDAPRSFVGYDDLLSDWQHTLAVASPEAAIDWPTSIPEMEAEVNSFLDQKGKHNVVSSRDMDSELEKLALDMHQILGDQWSGENRDHRTRKHFDRIAGTIERSESILDAWAEQLEWQSRSAAARQRELEKIGVEQQAEIARLTALKNDYENELQRLASELTESVAAYQEQIADLTSLRDAQQQEISELLRIGEEQRKEISLLDGIREDLHRELGNRHEQIEELNAARKEDALEISRLAEVADRQTADMARLSEQLETETGLRLALARDVRKLTDDLGLERDQGRRMQRALDDVYASTSWRITAPLRWLRLAPGRVGRFATLASGMARSPAVMKQVYARFLTVVRNRGPQHVITRMPDYLVSLRKQIVVDTMERSRQGALTETADTLPWESAGKEMLDCQVSVVIPTYNAGEEFYWLLRKLGGQKGISKVEIVIVDSGSSDQTVSIAREQGCCIIEIPQSEFSHSHARNLGAATAGGDYLMFMVQDAYPIGDYWLHGMVSFLLEHRTERVVAASCAEYCRADSDAMYDFNVDTHYRFLMCRDADRIGEFRGDDHMSLRSYGQLSDVSCLIPKKIFEQYGYRGDYAEDLDLGIRLIRDDHRVAMLASIKTIHSHYRPAHYYFKRSFVDVIFLVRQFEDFEYPGVKSFRGLLVGIVNLACHLTGFLRNFEPGYVSEPLCSVLATVETGLRDACRKVDLSGTIDLLDDDLSRKMMQYRQEYLDGETGLAPQEQIEADSFVDGFCGRLAHFRQFAERIYIQQDAMLRSEIMETLTKTFASTAGSYLGFMYLDKYGLDQETAAVIEKVREDLQAGI